MGSFKNATIMMGAVTETETLRETIKRISKTCDPGDIKEVIIGYPPRITPETLAVVNELSQTQFDFPVVTFQQTRPFMSGIADMIDAATGSHCILISSDSAEDLECLARMIEYAKQEGDTIVSLSRWLKGCRFFDYGRLKIILNYAGQFFLRVLYQTRLTDLTNPVQIAPAELYKSINWEYEDFRFLLEMVLKPLRLGYRFKEIPTNCYARRQGKTSNSKKQIFSYLSAAVHIRFEKKSKLTK